MSRRECLHAYCNTYVLDNRYTNLQTVFDCEYLEGPVTISIPECPICNKAHKDLVCYPVKDPMKNWTHEAVCPTYPDNILLFEFKHEKEESDA